MFAVAEISGRQYRVTLNEKIEVDLLEAEPGQKMVFDKVVLYAEADDKATIGKPYLEGASVEATVVEHFKGEKIRVFKFIPKKRHQKTRGHRQHYTRLEITAIKA